ncbi:MAG: pyridoxal-phosphate dependent enzyme [Deltaproteobacteria bacterium]
MERHMVVEATAVERAERVSRAIGREVYVKRDDRTHAVYGGNKIRKLVHLLSHARSRGATDLVTIGAVGSHHVLATTVHGRAAGFDVHAVLAPQPFTAHVEQTVRADIAQHAHLVAARGAWEVPWRVAATMLALRRAGRRPYLIPIGGSSPRGAMGYVDATRELAAQVSSGSAPSPDLMVCALGSGGTHAGLLGGIAATGLSARMVGVRVTDAWMVSRVAVAWMARGAARMAGSRVSVGARAVVIDHGHVGKGYGHPTDEARRALELFAEDGIALDLTYTAKAAAGLLAIAREGPARATNLFWHTLSSAPMAPLLEGAPDGVPGALDALMLR